MAYVSACITRESMYKYTQLIALLVVFVSGVIVGRYASHRTIGSTSTTKPSVRIDRDPPPQSQTKQFREVSNSLPNRNQPYSLFAEKEKFKSRMEEEVQKGLALVRAERDQEYADLFRSLGVDDSKSAHIREHIYTIHKAKILAAHADTEVAYARVELDNKLARALGEKAFESYKKYEQGDSARRESRSFTKFSEANGFSLPPNDIAMVTQLIEANEAYSMATKAEYGGPYKDYLKPMFGDEYIQYLKTKEDELRRQGALLLQATRTTQLQGSTIEALEQYYGTEIDKYYAARERASDPLGATIRRETAKLQEMRAAKQPDVAAIAAKEKMLRALQAGRKKVP